MYAEGPELELWSVCGACFSGDHKAHTETDNGKRCTCVGCCSSERDRQIAARAHPASGGVASAFMAPEPPEASDNGSKTVALEPFMNVLAGLPLAFGVERIGVPDADGNVNPQVTLRLEHATGSQMFPMSPAEATELANRLFRASTGLHVAR